MTWVWTKPPPSTVAISLDYDDKNSPVESFRLMAGVPVDDSGGPINLVASQHSVSEIEVFKCVPTTTRAPLIDIDVAEVVSAVSGSSAFQLYPVNVVARDGMTDRYKYLIPLKSRECLDLENSVDLKWALPEEKILLMDYTQLVYIPDCLDRDHIIAEDVSRQILVSQQLKDALSAIGDPGLHFCRPQDLRSVSNIVQSTGEI